MSVEQDTKDPVVSVVMPIFNVDRFLITSIESVLVQSFPDFELILVNDASTDSSHTICKRYADHYYEKIRLIANPTRFGNGESQNIGLLEARGKYVYFLEAGDALYPNALELLVDEMEKSGADVIHSATLVIPENNDFLLNEKTKVKHLSEPNSQDGWTESKITERVKKELFRNDIISSLGLNMYRTEFLRKNKITFPSIAVGEDLIFLTKVIFSTDRVYRVRIPFFIHRQRYDYHGEIASKNRYKHAKKALKIGLYTIRGFLSPFSDEEFPERDRMLLFQSYLYRMFRLYAVPYIRTLKDATRSDMIEVTRDFIID